MFKSFYVHYNRPTRHGDSSKLRHSPRGFTALITSSSTQRTLNIQVAFCSTKDEFVKKRGRAYAQQAEIVGFNPRELPSVMAKCANACGDGAIEGDYMYLLKYVV